MTISSLLEASHNEIMDEVVATVEKARNGRGHAAIPSKAPESTGGSFHRRSYKKDRNLRPLINFVKRGTGKLSKLPMDRTVLV